jgi:hypothetical protein
VTAVTETKIAYKALVGRRMRTGPWEDQRISTFRKIHEALDQRRWDDAAQLGAYFIDEANVIFSIYRQWIGDLDGFLRERHVDPAKIAARKEQVIRVGTLPDGTQPDPRRQWDRFLTAIQAFTAATYREQASEAATLMAAAKEAWRQCHDRDVDHTYALMSLVKEELGETGVRAMWDRIIVPLFAWRYEKFDIDKHPWAEGLEVLLLVSFEAMRAHLCGPDRTGDMDLIETEDRYILRFDPCGSGGRLIRGDTIEGTSPRMQPPYNWLVSDEPQTYYHDKPGVCMYCSHCIILFEEMPMDRFGYPVRVVDPPVYDPERTALGVAPKCQWTMFKDPTAVPEEYYTRIGRTKPSTFGSIAHGAPDLPSVTGMPGAG